MGPGPTPPLRAWTVTIHPARNAPTLTCTACGPLPQPRATTARSAALAHLARHTHSALIPPHLRTCQCGQHGCHWHPRHRGCDGPIVLLLTRSATGHLWRLADACRACAAATPHAAPIPDTLTPTRPHRPPGAAAAVNGSPAGHGEIAAGGKGVVYVYDQTADEVWATEIT